MSYPLPLRPLRVTIDDGAYVADFTLTPDEDENGLHCLVLADADGNQVEVWEAIDWAGAQDLVHRTIETHYQEAVFGPDPEGAV